MFLLGLFTGDFFGIRILSTVPSLYFLPPLILALSVHIYKKFLHNFFKIDIQFSSESFYADRQRLLMFVFGASFVGMLTLSLLTGMAGFLSTILFLIESGILVANFQVIFNFLMLFKQLNFRNSLYYNIGQVGSIHYKIIIWPFFFSIFFLRKKFRLLNFSRPLWEKFIWIKKL